MTKEDALSIALASHGTGPKDFLWNLGQLDDDTVKELNRLARQGKAS